MGSTRIRHYVAPQPPFPRGAGVRGRVRVVWGGEAVARGEVRPRDKDAGRDHEPLHRRGQRRPAYAVEFEWYGVVKLSHEAKYDLAIKTLDETMNLYIAEVNEGTALDVGKL